MPRLLPLLGAALLLGGCCWCDHEDGHEHVDAVAVRIQANFPDAFVIEYEAAEYVPLVGWTVVRRRETVSAFAGIRRDVAWVDGCARVVVVVGGTSRVYVADDGEVLVTLADFAPIAPG